MKTKFTLCCRTLFCCVLLFGANVVQAQESMSSARNFYSQNFDGLPSSGSGVWESGSFYFPGWAVYRTIASNTILVNNGSGNTGGVISYGATGSSERALGSIASAKAGEFIYTLLLQNNTGSAIKSVEVNYGEQWRLINVTAPQHVISFWYAISSDVNGFNTSPSNDYGWIEVPELKFYGPKFGASGTALNGNAAENRRAPEATLQIEVPAGHYLMLRWKGADELVADHGLAIDDVALSWYNESVEAPTPLPVELVSFSAKNKGGQVELQWLTASEEHNSHFIVERSPDGRLFEAIGYVTGQGTTTQPTNYTFLDEVPLPGYAYYRLQQVDEDESYTYSSVVSVTRASMQKEEVTVYPTITEGELKISGGPQLLQVTVVDVMGKKLLQQPLSGTSHSLDVSSLSSGPDVLVLQDEQGKRYTSRFTKK